MGGDIRWALYPATIIDSNGKKQQVMKDYAKYFRQLSGLCTIVGYVTAR